MPRIYSLFVAAAVSFLPVVQGEMITVPNGDFQSAVNSSGDVTSHTGVVSGNWQGSSSLETGFDSDVGSNVLRRFGSTNSGTSGHMREYSQYNFIDVSSNSGLHRLDFDFKRYQTPGSGKSASGLLIVELYGIDDDETPGWSTEAGRPFDTYFPWHVSDPPPHYIQAPELNGATLSGLGTAFTNQGNNPVWQSGGIDFDLGAPGEVDELVIRIGSRHHLYARENHFFDNFTLTAVSVPEPTSLLTFGAFAATLVFRRNRQSRV